MNRFRSRADEDAQGSSMLRYFARNLDHSPIAKPDLKKKTDARKYYLLAASRPQRVVSSRSLPELL